MTDILDTIIAAKRQEIASLRAIVDIDMLIENSSTPRPFRSMRKARLTSRRTASLPSSNANLPQKGG